MALNPPSKLLQLGKHQFHSRLILGTGKYSSLALMKKCYEASSTELVTVALRRVNLKQDMESNQIIQFIDLNKIKLIPNTSGAYSAKEVLRLAKIANALGLYYLKIEVMHDIRTLLPDPIETVKAVELIKQEFSSEEMFLMVYTNDDPVTTLRLLEVRADCIMPAGSPIGSGRGLANIYNLKMILELVNKQVPIILDAGIGSPVDVVLAMELGFDAILLNSAVANAKDPLMMAEAMKYACISGRLSHFSGRMEKKLYATASSPIV